LVRRGQGIVRLSSLYIVKQNLEEYGGTHSIKVLVE
jgi:hypothetical protein